MVVLTKSSKHYQNPWNRQRMYNKSDFIDFQVAKFFIVTFTKVAIKNIGGLSLVIGLKWL